jgi:hypothetical protein
MQADEATAVAAPIVSALEAAHERGIVHRDLKPAGSTDTPTVTFKQNGEECKDTYVGNFVRWR